MSRSTLLASCFAILFHLSGLAQVGGYDSVPEAEERERLRAWYDNALAHGADVYPPKWYRDEQESASYFSDVVPEEGLDGPWREASIDPCPGDLITDFADDLECFGCSPNSLPPDSNVYDDVEGEFTTVHDEYNGW